MASTITLYSNKIDINYPVVGKDNDTQGFRDNFSAIQAAFSVASVEVSNLQDNGVKLTETNDFNYNTIKNAVLQNTSELVKSFSVSTVSTSNRYVSIDYTEGSYHKCDIVTNPSGTGTVSFSIVNWPASGNYARLYLELQPDTISTTTISILGNTKLIGVTGTNVSFTTTSTIIYELWTIDNGNKIFGTISK